MRGLQFDSPRHHKTHPMSEKMRGALFNVLGDLSSLTVFDAYGGSGAMAFEALSRGAQYALITEVDPIVAKVISNNINKLNIGEHAKLVRANAASYVQNYPHLLYDIVICDPPYDDIHPTQLTQISTVVRQGGLLIISKPSGYPDFDFEHLELIDKKNYGDGALVFYRKI